MLPIPKSFEAARAGQLYLERAALIAEEAASFAKQHALSPARTDKFRIAAFGIDVQVSFCLPEASLFVPGAVADTERTLAWLYSHLDRVTSLFFSLDTHRALQIFHPAWWADSEGNPPPPFTAIRRSDLRNGTWHPRFEAEASREYLEKLEASGRYVLTIWPYHALQGGLSSALVPAVREAALFHAIAREAPTHIVSKGQASATQSYSVFAPEVRELRGEVVGDFNEALFAQLMSHDRVYVFGQAKSHCVLSTLQDLGGRIQQTDPGLAKKIWVLIDAMSPVAPPPLDPLPPDLDFPRLAEAGLRALEAQGMKLVRTTDPVEAR